MWPYRLEFNERKFRNSDLVSVLELSVSARSKSPWHSANWAVERSWRCLILVSPPMVFLSNC